jgi:hypothetical protein
MTRSRDFSDAALRELLSIGLTAEEGSLSATAVRAADDAPLNAEEIVASRFRITGLAGRGGMGDVYRAEDMKLGEIVALKFLPPASSPSPEMIRAFYDEVRLGRQVAHRNVCRIHDLLEVNGRPAIVMEYVDGETLASLLQRDAPLSYPTALQIARDVCAGVAAIHANGIVHGDLKPGNVLIDVSGRVRISDFGLSRFAGDESGTRPIAGTIAYMAPEQFTLSGASERADLFALGLLLYEIFTGVRGRDPNARQQANAEPLSKHQPLINPHLERMVMRCLAADPLQRPESVRAVLEAFPPQDAADTMPAGETARQTVRELSPPASIAVAAAAMLMLLAAILLSERLTLYAQSGLPLTPRELVTAARQYLPPGTASADGEVWGFESPDARSIVFRYRNADTDIILTPDGKLLGPHRPEEPNPAAAYSVYVTMLLLALAAGLYLAHRNISRRIVDVRAAWRVTAWVFACRVVYGLIATHHSSRGQAEFSLLVSLLETSVMLAVQVAIGTIALEPYVRRVTPRTLVGWTRVVHGRFFDSIVGRDLLLGSVAGLALRLIDHARNSMPSGVAPSHLAVPALSSIRETVANLFLFQSRAVFYALFGLFFFVLLKMILKRARLAVALWLIATTAAWARWDDPFVTAPFVAIQMAIVLLVLRRLGLLAATTAIFVHLLAVYTPLTSHASVFYFPQSATAVAAIAGVILFGLYVSMPRRREATV